MPLQRLTRYIPPFVWMAIMFFLSSRSDLPSNEIYVVDFITKKISHFIEYFILTSLWLIALKRPMPDLAILYSLIYAFLDETHQVFVPNRTGNLRDVGIDLIGISMSALIFLNFKQWRNLMFPPRSKTPRR